MDFFVACSLRRPSFFSCAFGCGASKEAFGILRRMSESRPSSVAGSVSIQRRLYGSFFKGLHSASLSPVDLNGNSTICCYFPIARSALTCVFFLPLRFFARRTTSAHLLLPLLLSATTQLHTASSSSTSVEHHTYLLHLAL